VITRAHYQGDLSDHVALAAHLARAGLSSEAAAARARLFSIAHAALTEAGFDPRAGSPRAFYVPGRIEVLGKHTDYAGGRTMVAAAERGFSIVAAPRRDRRVRVIDAVRRETAEFDLDPDLVPRAGHWANYPMTVGRRIARNFPGPLVGADIALASDLPPAAGMSSSSAMIVAHFLVLADANHLDERPAYHGDIDSLTDLAGYLGTIENGQTFGTLLGDRGVGTFGGSEDHTAILCARPGHVSQYRYCPVRFERAMPVPPKYAFAVAVSGVVAEKIGAAMEKYNAASRLARQIVEAWRNATGRNDAYLADILASAPDAAERLEAILRTARSEGASPEALVTRLAHFVAENDRIQPAAGDALARGDLAEFGRLVDQSQDAAERWLGNQVPETVFLARAAREHGAAAASAFGAGFGGAVWALVERDRAGPWLDTWRSAYHRRYPARAGRSDFFVTAAGPAAFRLG
jgi:galactokinase